MQEDPQKELTSLLEMAKENDVGWRKEKVFTKAEETETANVNAAWAKMKALEAKLEADELKSMSLEDANSEIWNMVVARNKVEATLEAFERKAMAQEDTLGKKEGAVEARRRFIVHRWVKGLARKKQHKEQKSTTISEQKEGEFGQ